MSRAVARDVSDEQVDALLAASRALMGVAMLSLADLDEGLSLVQFRALVVLTDAKMLKAAELAERLDVSASSVTRLCDRLVVDGLMRRVENPNSRREVLLTASRRGTSLVNRVMRRRREDLRQILATLEPGERTSTVTALRRFAANAGEVHGEHVLAEWPVL